MGTGGTGFQGSHRVGHGKAEVVMAVDRQRGYLRKRRDELRHLLRRQQSRPYRRNRAGRPHASTPAENIDRRNSWSARDASSPESSTMSPRLFGVLHSIHRHCHDLFAGLAHLLGDMQVADRDNKVDRVCIAVRGISRCRRAGPGQTCRSRQSGRHPQCAGLLHALRQMLLQNRPR